MPATLPRSIGRMSRLIERVLADPGRVDRSTNIIHRVVVLGGVSRNGRRYTEGCMRAAVPLYEGAKVYLDHTSAPSRIREITTQFGRLQNVRFDEVASKIVADLHYLAAHPAAPQVLEAAERMPSTFGLSHDADGDVVREVGENVVNKIQRVNSVDLVADPATTQGLFESVSSPETSDLEQKTRRDLLKLVSRLVDDGDEDPKQNMKDLRAWIKHSLEELTESTQHYSAFVERSRKFDSLTPAEQVRQMSESRRSESSLTEARRRDGDQIPASAGDYARRLRRR